MMEDHTSEQRNDHTQMTHTSASVEIHASNPTDGSITESIKDSTPTPVPTVAVPSNDSTSASAHTAIPSSTSAPSSSSSVSTRPKRQKVGPRLRFDEEVESTPATSTSTSTSTSSSSKKKQRKAPTKNKSNTSEFQIEDPNQLYGLYSTDYADFCSGSWFPIRYAGRPGEVLPSSSSSTSDLPPPSAYKPSPDCIEPILVHWSGQRQKYDPEELSLAFVRSVTEFSRLPVESMKVGKRVLVRDVLEDADFVGVSFWLATLTSEPMVTKSKGKKRTSGQANGTIGVQFQNTLWPPTDAALDSIYVLPKQKAQLTLIRAPSIDESPKPEDGNDESETHNLDSGLSAIDSAKSVSDPLALNDPANVELGSSMPIISPTPFTHSSPQLASVGSFLDNDNTPGETDFTNSLYGV